MGAINVNVTQVNYQATGQTVNVAQYSVDLAIEWDDDSTTPHTHYSTVQNVRFPNLLANAAITNAWLKEHLQELLLDALREINGLNT